MSAAAWIVCKACLNKSSPQKRDSLIAYLPVSEKKILEKLPVAYGDPTQGFESISERLNTIHFSWFSPFLRALPENEIRLFVASLNDRQAAGLKKNLRLSNNLPVLTPLAKHFFQNHLFDSLKENGLPLPASCLPASAMNRLLDLDEQDLDVLISHLGLHDLAMELRYIIETSKLKQIYGALTEAETHYLKTLMHQKEIVSFKRMSLDKWDGNVENLKSMLQQRGINRLAKSLYGQDPNLIWHVRHRLDTEKAAVLQKFCAPLEHPKASLFLSQQVMELAASIQNQKTP
jgi:hypothetical protein